MRLKPPMTLGLPIPIEMVGMVSPMLRRMFGAVALPAATETVISGIGANKGVVRGRARIVLGLDEAEDLADGDILVCPSTSPPWTPYFAVVSAIVTDGGGMISHAAIEAREYGIPAVVGTREATKRIPEGATITVDGEAGTVTIEP
jgi:pyruvate,water dikinase